MGGRGWCTWYTAVTQGPLAAEGSVLMASVPPEPLAVLALSLAHPGALLRCSWNKPWSNYGTGAVAPSCGPGSTKADAIRGPCPGRAELGWALTWGFLARWALGGAARSAWWLCTGQEVVTSHSALNPFRGPRPSHWCPGHSSLPLPRQPCFPGPTDCTSQQA